MAAAANGDRQSLAPGEIDGGDDIGNVIATRDQCRPPVDHPIPDPAGLVVARLGRIDHLAAVTAAECAVIHILVDGHVLVLPMR